MSVDAKMFYQLFKHVGNAVDGNKIPNRFGSVWTHPLTFICEERAINQNGTVLQNKKDEPIIVLMVSSYMIAMKV